MSLYKKFKKRMEDEMRHHTNVDDIIHVWSTFMSMMGEVNFNKMLSYYMKPEPGFWENAGAAFHGFHKGLRQGDTFNCFVRTKEVPIPDVEGKRKDRTKTVVDEHINGQIESLIWTMIHLDKNDAFQKTFMFYWDLHQQEVPMVEFIYEKRSINDWDDKLNGLKSVLIDGEEFDKKKFEKIFPEFGLESIIEQCLKNYRWNTGQEKKPKSALNWSSLEDPFHSNSRSIEDIISWESRTGKPFKFKETIVLPQSQEA